MPDAEDLQPAGALADATRSPSACSPEAAQITQPMSTSALGSVNGKKLGRKRTRVSRAEEAPQELREHALQIAEGDPVVDQEALDLMEHRRVRHVVVVVAVDGARQRSPGAAAAASP